MATSDSELFRLAQAIQAQVRTLINIDLKEICRAERLPVSGVKSTLQQRIFGHIHLAIQNKDHVTLNRLRERVSRHGGSPIPPIRDISLSTSMAAGPVTTNTHASSARDTSGTPSGYSRSHNPSGHSRNVQQNAQFRFKESPFYEFLEQLLTTVVLSPHASTKGYQNLSLSLTVEVAERMRYDPNLRVMLYSAQEPTLGPYSRVDVAFPHHFEVRINGDELKWNFKGLKNKAGSTRPADMTELLRKVPPKFSNSIQISHAYNAQRFFIFINLIRKHTVEDLKNRIKGGRIIRKDSVLREMRAKANDPDIVATSSVMSLKDPVSFVRMEVPCRSTVCSHHQCFDAGAFLQLQEQAPTWICPVCSKSISFEALVVDEYVQEILQQTSHSVDQVTIEPDGSWSQGNKIDISSNNGKDAAYDSDSDDDLVELTDARLSAVKMEKTERPSNAVFATQTPPQSSREASAAGSNAPRSGNKRNAEVIDLTLSDDDEPPRPAKRPAINQSNGHLMQPNNHQMRLSLPHQPDRRPPTSGVQPFRIQSQISGHPQRQYSQEYQHGSFRYWNGPQQ